MQNIRPSELLGQLETIGVDHQYLEDFVKEIRTVTKKDIQRVAKKYFTKKNNVTAELIRN